MLIPVALSAFFFMGQSLRLDEAQSLWQSSRGFTNIFTIVAGDVHVPLYHLILHWWRLYVADGVVAARALSLIFFVASIPALYLLGALAYSRRVALFACLIFALSPFMNWYGNEIRMYTLFTLLIILNQYFYLRIMKDERPSDHLWAGYLLTAIVGVFTHYFFFLSLAAQALFYFLRRGLFPQGSLRRFIFCAAVVAAVFAPWAWYVLHLGVAGFSEPSLPVPSSVNVFSAFSQFIIGFQSDAVNTVFLSLWPLAIILGLFALRRGERLEAATEYFIATILVSFGIAFFGSFLVAPVFVSRYLIFTIPSLYLIIGSLLEAYAPSFGRAGRGALVALMLVMLAVEIYNPAMPVKENYEQAAQFLNTHVTAQDAVVLSAPFTVYPLQYYYTGPSPIQTLPIWNQYAFGAIPAFSESALPQQVASTTAAAQNVYLLLSYDQGYEKNIHDYFDSHYQKLYQQTFSDDLTLYVYKLRYDTGASAIKTAFNAQ